MLKRCSLECDERFIENAWIKKIRDNNAMNVSKKHNFIKNDKDTTSYMTLYYLGSPQVY